MSEDSKRLEQRLNKIKSIYLSIDKTVDSLPDDFFGKHKEKIKEMILGDKDLKQFMDEIENARPPRLFLIGRTGVGKSSIINALCESYVASISDTRSCTEGVEIYQLKDGDQVRMEICDSRGIAESEQIDPEQSAEDMLIEQINQFSPDAAMLVLGFSHRDAINKDVQFLKKLSSLYRERHGDPLPIIVVINRCDEAFPPDIKAPDEYTEVKENKIKDQKAYYSKIIRKEGLQVEAILCVCSLIYWGKEDGTILDAEEIANLPKAEREKLRIIKDYRYQIQDLSDLLEETIKDPYARMGFRMAARLEVVIRRIAKKLVTIISGLAATIALTPIPFSDIYFLLGLQTILVLFISALSGRDLDLEAAKEFLFSVIGIGTFGGTLRLVSPPLAKLADKIKPGVGLAVSAGIASLGTKAIGEAAIRYYIDGEDLETAKSLLKHRLSSILNGIRHKKEEEDVFIQN